ncbi:MAG: choice-of-anchor tandem repeat GloVer-containing protein [Pirellulales bacterium]
MKAFSSSADGQNPFQGLTVFGKSLVGVTRNGGQHGSGTLFRIGLNGTGFTVRHHFTGDGGGAHPYSAPALAGDSLYGIAHGTEIWGGVGYECGTLYRLDPDGTKFEVLHTFDSMKSGDTPMRSLVLLDDALYGTTAFGGIGGGKGNGTVWKFARPAPSRWLFVAGGCAAFRVVGSMGRWLWSYSTSR